MGIPEIIKSTIAKYEPIFPDSRWRYLRVSSILYFVFLSNFVMCCWVSITIPPDEEHICYKFGMFIAVVYLISILYLLMQEDTWRFYYDFVIGNDLLD